MGYWQDTPIKCPLCGQKMVMIFNFDHNKFGKMYGTVYEPCFNKCGTKFDKIEITIDPKNPIFIERFNKIYTNSYEIMFDRWKNQKSE